MSAKIFILKHFFISEFFKQISFKFLLQTVTEVDSKEYARVASCISQTNDSKVIQIRGLPWSVDKAYIMKLFPSEFYLFLNFDVFVYGFPMHLSISAITIPKHHIQIEIDENNRRTGYAFVEFANSEEYEMAFKSDFKAINGYNICLHSFIHFQENSKCFSVCRTGSSSCSKQLRNSIFKPSPPTKLWIKINIKNIRKVNQTRKSENIQLKMKN